MNTFHGCWEPRVLQVLTDRMRSWRVACFSASWACTNSTWPTGMPTRIPCSWFGSPPPHPGTGSTRSANACNASHPGGMTTAVTHTGIPACSNDCSNNLWMVVTRSGRHMMWMWRTNALQGEEHPGQPVKLRVAPANTGHRASLLSRLNHDSRQ